MKRLLHMHRPPVGHTRRTLHYLSLVGAVFLTACTSQSAPIPVPVAVSAHTAPSRQASLEQRPPLYRLRPEALDHIFPRQQKSIPFRLLAQGSDRARIVNQRGDVVRSAVPGGTIFAIEGSPDEKWFLLFTGGPGYLVASAGTLLEVAKPPTRPDGPEGATDIVWRILDNDHLVGQADLPSLDTEGLTAAEVESLPPRDTLIYVYTLSSDTMAPVEIDVAISRPFHIRGVTDGQVELLHYVTDERFGAKIVPIALP